VPISTPTLNPPPTDFFYINICGFIGRGKFLYETQVLDDSYLQFKFQLPTSDSKVPIEGFVPLDAP